VRFYWHDSCSAFADENLGRYARNDRQFASHLTIDDNNNKTGDHMVEETR